MLIHISSPLHKYLIPLKCISHVSRRGILQKSDRPCTYIISVYPIHNFLVIRHHWTWAFLCHLWWLRYPQRSWCGWCPMTDMCDVHDVLLVYADCVVYEVCYRHDRMMSQMSLIAIMSMMSMMSLMMAIMSVMSITALTTVICNVYDFCDISDVRIFYVCDSSNLL